MSVLSTRVVTSRKPSLCFGCGLTYGKGIQMQRMAWKHDDGSINRISYCPACREYWSEYMEANDTICLGDLRSEDPETWEGINAKFGCGGSRIHGVS